MWVFIKLGHAKVSFDIGRSNILFVLRMRSVWKWIFYHAYLEWNTDIE